MGKSSKPLTIMLSEDLYESHRTKWDELESQGYTILMDSPDYPDIYLAPYAMRMTADMLTQLPAALDLAIKGARALRYPPKGATEWKGAKGVKAKVTRKRANAEIQAEAVTDGESILATTDQGTSGSVGDIPA